MLGMRGNPTNSHQLDLFSQDCLKKGKKRPLYIRNQSITTGSEKDSYHNQLYRPDYLGIEAKFGMIVLRRLQRAKQ
jgi:hypothetical protein